MLQTSAEREVKAAECVKNEFCKQPQAFLHPLNCFLLFIDVFSPAALLVIAVVLLRIA